jgi:hypothetical protein
LENYEEFIEAVLKSFPNDSGSRDDAIAVCNACLAVIDEDSLSAFYCLEEIETDPKVWLDELNAGINFARRTMPADDFHYQFLGAFKMAEVYLMRDWFKKNG